MIESIHTGYEYLLKFFPGYDYHKTLSEFRLHVDFSRADNIVGHQQRAFNVYWAIQQCWMTGEIGLELGFGGVTTPWCLGTDSRRGADHYGGTVDPALVVRGEDPSPFGAQCFNLILANHVLEHLEGDLYEIFVAWHRVIKPGGIFAMILPDQRYNDVMKMDSDHKQAWKAPDFKTQILDRLDSFYEIVEHDTLGNKFSFNSVLRRR